MAEENKENVVRNSKLDNPVALNYHLTAGLKDRYLISALNVYDESGETNLQETLDNMGVDGIPILNNKMYEDLVSKEKLPEDYITIPDANDINVVPETTSFTNVGNGTYIDILFSAIRSLQAEVAKMKNSFTYGLYSYNNKETAMSRVVSSGNDITEDEPLWAADEEDLSKIEGLGLSLDKSHTLEPKDNVSVGDGYLEVEGTVTWNGTSGEFNYKTVRDAKLYLFMTTSNLNIKINLVNYKDEARTLTVDLSECGFSESVSGRYNVLFVLSRAHEYNENFYGYNFAWVSVADYATLNSEYGYWTNGNNIKGTATYFGGSQGSNLEDNRYYISSIEFKDTNIYKFNCYSKYQNFSNTVEPINPATDDDYKYRVAHITIRSVLNMDELNSIKEQLPKNELVYNEGNGLLYIKTKTGIKKISAGSGDDNINDTGMEKAEIIEWLEKNGIVTTENGGNLEISKIADITFVHQATGKKFKFAVDSEGSLKGTELSSKTLENRMSDAEFVLPTVGASSAYTNIRGFVGSLGHKEQNKENPNNQLGKTKDIGLYSDRIKIGAFYIPDLDQTNFNCSHAYIELENTSDKDFPLENCYLHYATGKCEKDSEDINEYSLALTGIIPAGGTYLIRCKQHTDFSQADCFIKVNSYDQEWYIGRELFDIRINPNGNNTLLLTYKLPGQDLDPESNFSYKTILIQENSNNDEKTNAPWVYHPNYIDSVSIVDFVRFKNQPTWAFSKMKSITRDLIPKNNSGISRDRIYKNTFELDPAKQAFQSCNTYDSSRKRNQSQDDYQCLAIDDKYISFPKTNETRPVDFYTPKASYEHKNVCTDKSKLNKEKPNMVTCSFGINIHTTRCFNWISCGQFDEYVWVRKRGNSEWARFESYKPGTPNDKPLGGITRKTFGNFNNKTTGNTNDTIQSVIYDRMTGHFPADGTSYTAHKCILNIKESAASITTPEVYEYIVGRADINSNPLSEHVSDIQTFTIYPTTFTPRIFQTTDQQGFHWIEYQCWAAAAEELNKTINEAIGENYSNQIIPIFVNTGDMTQNGTRINEWLDYYNAGKCLFNHLEQMNVVGNNDLCNSIDELNPDGSVKTISYERLGTGDDPGKSNAHYFHIFYCYEIDPDVALPIISNSKATHYIPSLYYFESRGATPYRFVMFNSEITATTCREWYKQFVDDKVINVYTGWEITSSSSAVYDSSFTTVYTMVYNMLNAPIGTKVLVACHEMPFTVITNANLLSGNGKNLERVDRSLNGSSTGSLVGCHGNRLNSTDSKAIYWFSRLLEYFKVRLVIGGHKHTYACTNPVREFYYYTKNGVQTNSLADGPMTMTSTLENDNCTWEATVGLANTSGTDKIYKSGISTSTMTVNTTKFPLMKSSEEGIRLTTTLAYPYYGVSSLEDGVVYFMCQATGSKLKSNKELPAPDQRFAYVIPKTKVGTDGDTPNENQQKPMFAEIELGEENYKIYLYRVENIMNGIKFFSQLNYNKAEASYSYLKGNEADGSDSPMYGHWISGTKTPLIEVKK